jgi:hypothetical protein
MMLVLVAVLMLSANCHPWYLSWLLPLLVFVPWPPIFLWIALAPVFYEVVIRYRLLGEWNGSGDVRWLVYGPVFAMMAFSLGLEAWRKLARKPDEASSP